MILHFQNKREKSYNFASKNLMKFKNEVTEENNIILLVNTKLYLL